MKVYVTLRFELYLWGSIVFQVSCYALLFKLGVFEQETKYHKDVFVSWLS